MMRWIIFLLFCVGALTGCRGDTSEKPPLHGIRNMFDQPKYKPQSPNRFFADGRAARPLIAQTVAREALETSPVLSLGKNPDGSWVMRNPLPIDRTMLERGRQRFNIFCAPCHDQTGSGRGLIASKYQGFPPPPSFHDDRIRLMPDGQVFDIITQGIRTMPSYRSQIPEPDRWAVIAYLRALERSQRTTLDDVPPGEAQKLETSKP